MKIRAVMNRTNSNLCPPQYQIDKVVEISRFDFDAFMIQPQDRYEFIKENRVTATPTMMASIPRGRYGLIR